MRIFSSLEEKQILDLMILFQQNEMPQAGTAWFKIYFLIFNHEEDEEHEDYI